MTNGATPPAAAMACSIAARRVLDAAVRQIAWAMAMIEARDSGHYLNPDRKAPLAGNCRACARIPGGRQSTSRTQPEGAGLIFIR